MLFIFSEELWFSNSLANILLSSIISERFNSLDFNPHLHIAFLVSISYPLYVQLFSHKDNLLFINSFFLSSNNISVPLSVVEGEHSLL